MHHKVKHSPKALHDYVRAEAYRVARERHEYSGLKHVLVLDQLNAAKAALDTDDAAALAKCYNDLRRL